MKKLCRYCCYAAVLINKDKDNAKDKSIFCSKIGMTVGTERDNCIYFQKPLSKEISDL